MKKILFLNTLVAVALLLGSCGKCCKKGGDNQTQCASKEAKSEVVTAKGTFFGVLPCADCAGIETTVNLNEDNSYSQTDKYLNADSTVVKEEGTFHFCSQRNIATLISSKNDTTLFAVEENQIVLLGADGKKVEGELADHYVLKKK